MTVLATIEPTQVQVDPGAASSVRIRVRNRGSIVDRFELTIVGPTAPWAAVDPPALRLFPDQEGEATITFRPPRGPSPAADAYPFGVAIRPAADPASTSVEEGRVTVTPFVNLATEIVPQTSRGSRAGVHEVTVHNLGNAVAEVAVKASDPDLLLHFAVIPERFGLKPDAASTVKARVIPAHTFFLGSPKRLPFTVQVDEPSAGSRQIAASFEQGPIIPSWVRPLGTLAVAAIAALMILPRVLGVQVPWIAAVPTPTPLVTVAPTAPPPTATLAPPSAAPTPVPTAGPPDSLVWAGSDGTLNGAMGLSLVCAKGDATCAANAWNRIALILDNLQNKAQGALLIDFKSTPTGTLPLVATWKNVPFPYTASDGPGQTKMVAIDLAPILAGGTPYALVSGIDGRNHEYVLPSADAQLLFNILYHLDTPVPTPPPVVAPGITLDYGTLYSSYTFQNLALSSIQFVQPQP